MIERADNVPELPVAYDEALIPEPIRLSPGYVGSTYPLPDGVTPDEEKNQSDAVSMQHRLDPKAGPRTRLGLVDSGRQFTTYSRGWDGVSTRDVRHVRTAEGTYLDISRRLSAAVIVGSALLHKWCR